MLNIYRHLDTTLSYDRFDQHEIHLNAYNVWNLDSQPTLVDD